ncbi:MAG: arylesterase [Rhizobiaceae bacterium]|nr:arylesterase [Rhizobiaceae bacterium]
MKIKDLLRAFTGFFSALLIMASMSIGSANAKPLNVVAFGDSLMAGYQLDRQDAFPNRLAEALNANGLEINMTNAAVSGDTTSGGLARLDWSVPDGTDVVILELGANDALRGLPVETTRENLDNMMTRLRERNITVFLMGMLAPPNMGTAYEEAFNSIYPELADKFEVELYPFFLEGVAGIPELNLSDGIHPNPKGIAVMVENILPAAQTFFKAQAVEE